MQPDWWIKKQRRWIHNSFFGHARMMQMQARSIITSASTTMESKEIAYQIEQLAIKLRGSLKTRID